MDNKGKGDRITKEVNRGDDLIPVICNPEPEKLKLGTVGFNWEGSFWFLVEVRGF